MIVTSRLLVLLTVLKVSACTDTPDTIPADDSGPSSEADAADSRPDAGIEAETDGGVFAADANANADAEYRIDREAAITCTSTAIDGLFPPDCVAPERRVPLPTHAKHVIDLSSWAPGSRATCGPYFGDSAPGEEAILLPHDRSLYPLVVRLPALSGADSACETCPDYLFAPPGPLHERFGERLQTAFGIAIETYDGMRHVQQPTAQDTLKYIAVTVPPPWYLVSGGCGEACAYLCLGGYQEFGIQSCSNIPWGALGFATWDPAAPAAEAVIMLVDAPIPQVDGLAGRQCFFSD